MPRQPQLCSRKTPGRRRYFYGRIHGKQHYLGTDRREAARQLTRLKRAAGGRYTAIPRDVTSAAAAIGAYCRVHPNDWTAERLRVFLRWQERLVLADIDDDTLVDYVRWLTSRGSAAQTIRHNVRLVRKMLTWCAHPKRGWLRRVPANPRMPTPSAHPRDIPAETLQSVIDNVPTCSWPIIGWVVNTGARPGEACRLRWDHVRLTEGRCILPPALVKTGKRTGRPRTINLTPAAKAILEELPHRTGFVFISRLRKPYTPAGLRTIMRRAGWSSANSLRHTFAQHALDQGTPIVDVAKLLGHRDLRTVLTYAQVRDRRSRRVAQSLAPTVLRQSHDQPPLKKSAGAASPRRSRHARRSHPPTTQARESSSAC